MTTALAPFEVLRFEALPTLGGVAILELDGRFLDRPSERPRLLVESRDRRELPAARVRLEPWSATFAVPLAELEGGFTLVPDRGPLIALPSPDVVAEGAGDRFVAMARTANDLRHRLAAAQARAEELEVEIRGLDEALVAATDRAETAEAEAERLAGALDDVAARAQAAESSLSEILARAEAAEAEVHDLRAALEAAETVQVEDRSSRLTWEEDADEEATQRIAALATAQPAETNGAVVHGEPQVEGETVAFTPLDVEVATGEEPEHDDVDEDAVVDDEEHEQHGELQAIPSSWTELTPARIAVGGVLAFVVLWFLLILVGLGPI